MPVSSTDSSTQSPAGHRPPAATAWLHGFGQQEVRRRHFERAAIRHGIAGVDGEVEQHLLDLAGIDLDAPQIGRQRADELDVLADDAPEHVLERQHRHVEVEHLRHQHLTAAEGQQLARQRGGAIGGALDALQQPPPRRMVQAFGAERLGVAADHLQQVVEVVGHAAGQPAERADLLRAPQLLGQIVVGAERVGGDLAPALVAQRDEDRSRRGPCRPA